MRCEGGIEATRAGFKVLPSLVRPERILDVWTEIIGRHSLLASTIEYEGGNKIRFWYAISDSAGGVRELIRLFEQLRPAQVSYRRACKGKIPHGASFSSGSQKYAPSKYLSRSRPSLTPLGRAELLAVYLNGPRTLSDERLAYLLISTPALHFTPGTSPEQEQEYNFCLFSTHFLGDGIALHSTANEFFGLLAADGESGRSIEVVLREKAESEGECETDHVGGLAQAMESKLVTPDGWGRMAWAAARVDYNRIQAKLIVRSVFFAPSRSR